MDDYKFLKIEDAIACINQKVNLIGAILDFSVPQKTKGTDYFCKLKIIDESHPKCGIPVHLFAQHMDALPQVASIGDIIHLSRVMMKTHEGDVYAIFNKRFSSFALYEGKNGEGFHPYQVSLRFHAREQDEKLIADLRKWLADSKVIDVPINFILLREINEVDTINIACKVLHICEIAKDEWMVFLWDGTDAPPLSIHRKLEDEMHNQLPLHLEPLPLSRDVLCTFPTVGTILRVTIDENCRKYILQLLKIGQWVKLFNVPCKVREGLWYGVLTPSTKIQDMPNEDTLISERQSNYDHRLSCKLERMPYWSFPWPSRITEVSCDDVPFATLMDVLTCRKVRKKFRCVVRFVAAIPWQVEDFCSPRGTYRVRFTVEDPTARIHAFAYAEDGEKFFNGYLSADVLSSKLNKLLGVAISADGKEIKDAARNPPWVQCCLISHYLKCCKICDTKLVGQQV
ncbi:hypothetical protein QUC31_007276 [Theobroma cacao]|uniref:Protection of telomeres 1 protein isoform 1 n=3 Tax=Theobroma cacao TaxID=3641 RepID=A0A061G2R0_THECC|nr:PREDICTED: protection of telomeres protein 1b isoform X1 [Theobroma cacao]EOY21313.1 Protection of telomeres 1 protein isoform 1 [Theobroma cacao]EOY21314.1 Protection of telomeres 1 protein isoform 1 [Theobroma cacao]